MKLLFSVTFLAVLTCNCEAQVNNTAQVEGKVIDTSKQGVENVNVLVLNLRDSLLVKLSITNGTGYFFIRGIQPGNYLLALSKEGYTKQYLPVTIGENKLVVPTVILLNEVKELLSVTVTSRRPLVEQMGDKIIYNVESDPMAFAETAVDLLRKTPMVTVDGQGNIQLNEQNSFKVFLNGRETSMFAHNVNEALKGFPGGLIKKIEVISNPSAKYDGEGVGGIINIITKKKVAGYNGTLSAAAATADGSSTINRLLNIKYKKFGISSYLLTSGYKSQKSRLLEEIESRNPVAYFKRISNGNTLSNNESKSGNLELSYEADSFHTVSAYVLLGSRADKVDGTMQFDLVSSNRMDTVKSIYTSATDNNFSFINAGLDYIQKFKSNPEKEFSIRLNGDFGTDNSNSTSAQNSLSVNRFIVNESKVLSREYTIQTDFIQPLSKGNKLELGAKAIIRNATSDYQSLFKYNASAGFKVNQPNTDYFTYHQDVYSVYASTRFTMGKFVLRTGLRLEQTELNSDFLSSAVKVAQSYTSILPNIQVTTKGKKRQTLAFSYTVRLARPFIWNLNPFINNTDSLNISKGNPALQPQTFHSLSLQYRFSSGKTFFSIGLSHNFSKDRIIQFSTFNNNTGVIATSPINIGKNNQTVFSISINTKPNRRWEINTDGWLAYDVIQQTKAAGSLKNNGFSGNGLFNSNYLISKKLSASVTTGFTLAAPTLQINYPVYLYYGMGMNYTFMKDKLALSLSARNIFNREDTMPTNVFEDNSYQRTTATSYPDRIIKCSLTWSFGKLSESVSKKRGVTNDDLLGK
jgi:outer membrane receptor protein involved in Fe transport